MTMMPPLRINRTQFSGCPNSFSIAIIISHDGDAGEGKQDLPALLLTNFYKDNNMNLWY